MTKQVTATLALQEVAAGRLELGAPVRRYLPDTQMPYADSVSIRQLMQHRSGLPPTDAGWTKDQGAWPQFYSVPPDSAETGFRFCEGPGATPPGSYHYNNCDYIVLAAVLEALSGVPYETFIQTRLIDGLGLEASGLFPTHKATVPGYIGGLPEPPGLRLDNYGAAGALYGSLRDLLAFDRALLGGRLLAAPERSLMWEGDSDIGFMALGQWSFPAQLAACDHPFNVVERRGAIGGVQVANLLLPEQDLVVIMATNRAESDFSFGEIWQQRGVSHDVLSVLVCPPR